MKTIPRSQRRLAREWKTVSAMIRIYCRAQHGGETCAECTELTRYVRLRLDRCRFGENKPTCARCPVHCYQKKHREQIKAVMRFSGPRMLWKHPWLSLRHWVDGLFLRPSTAPVQLGTGSCGSSRMERSLVTVHPT